MIPFGKIRWTAICAAAGLVLAMPVIAVAETVKIAFIEVLSGPFGLAGQSSLTELREAVRHVNSTRRSGDPEFEIVPFDGKGTPQESTNALRSAIDQDIRYVTQGGGSGVAFALIDAINKQAQRDPSKSMVFLNYAAGDPALTGDRCSFWHFRFYPSSEMQMNVLAAYLRGKPEVKKIYLLNQNYAHGQQVAKAAKTFIPESRPDIQIVGEEYVQIGAVRDFAPYIAKISATGADSIITANWGSDLSLLIKAAKDYGLNVDFYTLSAVNPGIPTQLGSWGIGKVHVLWNWLQNSEGSPELEKLTVAFREKTGLDYMNVAHWNSMYMLREAMRKAQSTEPKDVAIALEGMKFHGLMGDVEMRASDHQLQGPIVLGEWGKKGSPGIRHESEKSGHGFRVEASWPAGETAMPTTCKMVRP